VTANEFREYENGVADVLASIVGESATVERNVRLPSRSDGRHRQIDVLVTGTVFGLPDTRLVVDCKHWKKAVDKPAVEAFIGLVEDVGADMGLLVSAAGVTGSAVNRARTSRGIRVKPLSITELARWCPRGTVSLTIELPQVQLERATKSLREAGFRVRLLDDAPEHVSIEAFQHYGAANPSGEQQQAHHQRAERTLKELGVPYRRAGNGITISGGTPAHRWIPVRIAGNPYVLNVLAATEAELEDAVVGLAADLGMPPALLIVDRPDGWPATAASQLWAAARSSSVSASLHTWRPCADDADLTAFLHSHDYRPSASGNFAPALPGGLPGRASRPWNPATGQTTRESRRRDRCNRVRGFRIQVNHAAA
jgi:hypothetical protein